jgi:7,8-dihydroneopterin aldolase/epimerase/oxygenase
VIPVLTGIYSEETHLPQPLKISARAWLSHEDSPGMDQRSGGTFNIRSALLTSIPNDVHFPLIEAVADKIMEAIFSQCAEAFFAEIKIVKLALTERNEEIGILMGRRRPGSCIFT